LKRGSHTSIAQRRAAILAYVEVHNERDTPFKWVKTADEILRRSRPAIGGSTGGGQENR
jgi:hypothetical protein